MHTIRSKDGTSVITYTCDACGKWQTFSIDKDIKVTFKDFIRFPSGEHFCKRCAWRKLACELGELH